MKKGKLIAFLFPAAAAVCGCTGISCSGSAQKQDGPSETVRIVTWNTQTFFDAVKDGTEYAEFRSSKSGWSRDAYTARLDRLCAVIRKLDADIYVFEEIENEGILYDISNRLADSAWNVSRAWRYAAFAKHDGDAIGCAVLSRIPLGAMSVHALDIRTDGIQPQMRPLMQVTVNGRNRTLELFVNHWKSKSGEKSSTETWRTWEESVLAGRITRLPDGAVLACGDFNRDISGFVTGADGTVILTYVSPDGMKKITASSPWLTEQPQEQGSYVYSGTWEKIDHFFSSGKAQIRSFRAESEGEWTDGNGRPAKYRIYTGSGYSDHLPVSAEVTF